MPAATARDTTLIGEWQHAADLLEQHTVSSFEFLVVSQGDGRLFGVDLTPEELAARWLGEWFVYGQCDPDIADPWFEKFTDEVSAALEVPVAAKDMEKWDLRMRALFPKYWHLAVLSMSPDQQRDYALFRLGGLHSGRVLDSPADRGVKAK